MPIVVPVKLLKIGYRHVSTNGDGFFWKDRWVVDEITDDGVVSIFERWDPATKSYNRDFGPRLINKWDSQPVGMSLVENPTFDQSEPAYVAWLVKYTQALKQYTAAVTARQNELESMEFSCPPVD